MAGSAPSNISVPNLRTHVRKQNEPSLPLTLERSGTAAPSPDGSAAELAEFTRQELARISDYVAQQVSKLSENLKSLRAKVKHQSHLIDEMALGLEAALPALETSAQDDRETLDDVVRNCFVDLRNNVESLSRYELSLAASLQFQDRISQEIEQLNKILAFCGKDAGPSRIEEIAENVDLADLRTRLFRHFGRTMADADDHSDDVEFF